MRIGLPVGVVRPDEADTTVEGLAVVCITCPAEVCNRTAWEDACACCTEVAVSVPVELTTVVMAPADAEILGVAAAAAANA